MTENEKLENVINRLGSCVEYFASKVKGVMFDEWIEESRKAIALLKAQEPRVMTWDEVKAWHEIDEIYRDPIFVEYRYEKAFGPSRWYISRFGIGAMSDDEKKLYNKYIRCWTSRTTDEQREAVKWE